MAVALAALNASSSTADAATVGPSYVPMAVTSEQYQWVPALDPSWPCVSEDDQLQWAAGGSLAPGEPLTFTPLFPDCNNSRAIVVSASWDASSGARLELSSVVPGASRVQSGVAPGVLVRATKTSPASSRLCMFPFFSYSDWQRASFTVVNVGTATAYTANLTGYDANDWEMNYYDACQNVDADRDGWSDSIEHGMENLTVNEDRLMLMGSDYLRGVGTPGADNEYDFFPPDLDDDGAVTQADVDRVSAHLGQGTGVPISLVTPNPGANNFLLQKGAWRRFDLDGDVGDHARRPAGPRPRGVSGPRTERDPADDRHHLPQRAGGSRDLGLHHDGGFRAGRHRQGRVHG